EARPALEHGDRHRERDEPPAASGPHEPLRRAQVARRQEPHRSNPSRRLFGFSGGGFRGAAGGGSGGTSSLRAGARGGLALGFGFAFATRRRLPGGVAGRVTSMVSSP